MMMKKSDLCREGESDIPASGIEQEIDHLLSMDVATPADMAAAFQELRRVIADRQRAEEELLEREARLVSVFRAAPVGIGLDVDRVIMDANERLFEMLGCEPGDLPGKNARIESSRLRFRPVCWLQWNRGLRWRRGGEAV